jgi:AcrR family transcriptional regulator
VETVLNPKKRARGEEQKEARRRHILETAEALFRDQSFADTTMADVAARAGLSKGAVYLYFETKEQLFLAMLVGELAAWLDAVDARLETGTIRRPEAAARLFAASLAERPTLTKLLSLMDGVLERNIDEDTALAWKRFLAARLQRTGALLEALLPALRPGGGVRLLLQMHALVIGLRQMSDPAPVMKRLADEPDLALFQIDFERELTAALTALLRAPERALRGEREAT